MMEQEWTIGGRSCLLFGQEDPKCLLIWMLGSDERNDVAGMAAMIADACDIPFVMAAYCVDDWERDLTPWPDPFLDKRPEVGKMAGKTLHAVTDSLLPELVKQYGKLPIVLGGYSLAGLFALWAALETDGFDGIAAAFLANCNPIGIIFTSIFIKYINTGGEYLANRNVQFSRYVADIIIATIIYVAG
ncbi:MAG: hypothetical protein J6W23_06065, partial [Victivallales bacterium]|nr:hypothetical protein [Victivallales bacterium]